MKLFKRLFSKKKKPDPKEEAKTSRPSWDDKASAFEKEFLAKYADGKLYKP
jgi:hypothetical protein